MQQRPKCPSPPAETSASADLGNPWAVTAETSASADLGNPWAVTVRVKGDVNFGDGEPAGQGEVIVRLVNAKANSIPAALDKVPPIDVAIGHPWVSMGERYASVKTLGGIQLEPEAALALAEGLQVAANAAYKLEATTGSQHGTRGLDDHR